MTIIRIPLTERLWSRVTKAGPDDCWLWNGPTSHGYGILGKGGRGCLNVGAHRVAYEEAFGPIPPGLHVCHRCDVRACCNPRHLFVGTAADNIADCVAKGRARNGRLRGEENGRAKLTARQALKIRTLPGQNTDIARRYGVSAVLVGLIKNRKAWKHLP